MLRIDYPETHEKWGIDSYISPRVERPFNLSVIPTKGSIIRGTQKARDENGAYVTREVIAGNEDIILGVFDITAPLPSQIARVQESLEYRQKEKMGRILREPQVNTDALLYYIRILDIPFEIEDNKIDEITEILYKGTGAVPDN